jgi:hypothetical protein
MTQKAQATEAKIHKLKSLCKAKEATEREKIFTNHTSL